MSSAEIVAPTVASGENILECKDASTGAFSNSIYVFTVLNECKMMKSEVESLVMKFRSKIVSKKFEPGLDGRVVQVASTNRLNGQGVHDFDAYVTSIFHCLDNMTSLVEKNIPETLRK